jgi:hypothetical protein
MSQLEVEMEDNAAADDDDRESAHSAGSGSSEASVSSPVHRTCAQQQQRQQQQQAAAGGTAAAALAAVEGAGSSRGSCDVAAVPPVIHAAAAGKQASGDASVCSAVSIALTADATSGALGSGTISSSYCPDSHVAAGSAVVRPGAWQHGLAAGAHAPGDSWQQHQQQQWQGRLLAESHSIAEESEGAGGGSGGPFINTAFAAMSAQLAAQRAAARRGSNAGGRSSGGGSSTASADKVQPLVMSAWHKDRHESGFIVPEAAAASRAGGDGSGGAEVLGQPWGAAGGGCTQRSAGLQRRSGTGGGVGMVSPFANAIQLAHSVASDEVV